MAIYELDGMVPQLAASAWVADSAQVMGHVVLGEDTSVWFGTVIRGDTETITIGAGSNLSKPLVTRTTKEPVLNLSTGFYDHEGRFAGVI
ncbi:hypothetical protein ACQKEU_28680, partial [Acidovorax sp. NPDC077664]